MGGSLVIALPGVLSVTLARDGTPWLERPGSEPEELDDAALVLVAAEIARSKVVPEHGEAWVGFALAALPYIGMARRAEHRLRPAFALAMSELYERDLPMSAEGIASASGGTISPKAVLSALRGSPDTGTRNQPFVFIGGGWTVNGGRVSRAARGSGMRGVAMGEVLGVATDLGRVAAARYRDEEDRLAYLSSSAWDRWIGKGNGKKIRDALVSSPGSAPPLPPRPTEAYDPHGHPRYRCGDPRNFCNVWFVDWPYADDGSSGPHPAVSLPLENGRVLLVRVTSKHPSKLNRQMHSGRATAVTGKPVTGLNPNRNLTVLSSDWCLTTEKNLMSLGIHCGRLSVRDAESVIKATIKAWSMWSDKHTEPRGPGEPGRVGPPGPTTVSGDYMAAVGTRPTDISVGGLPGLAWVRMARTPKSKPTRIRVAVSIGGSGGRGGLVVIHRDGDDSFMAPYGVSEVAGVPTLGEDEVLPAVSEALRVAREADARCLAAVNRDRW